MARPTKVGLDYFPLDVSIGDDDKIFYLEAEHGLEGFAVFVKILTKIYEKGYYILWNNFTKNIFSRKVNVDINTLDSIVNVCIKCSLFDANLYEKHEVLTSKQIQKRYLEAVKRRNEVEIIEELSLIDINNYSNIVNVYINPHSDNINGEFSTQSKVKESKVKKRKGEESKVKKLSKYNYQEIVDCWNELKNIPNIRKLTDDRRKKLKLRLDEIGEEEFKKAINKISQSDFCKGNNNRNWKSDFDWIIGNSTNIVKVLEGKYDNKESKNGGNKKHSKHYDEKTIIETYDEWKDEELKHPFEE